MDIKITLRSFLISVCFKNYDTNTVISNENLHAI